MVSSENPYPVDLQILGARICLRRVTLGLSQRDLVNELYYERLINDVECGLVAPSPGFLNYLAECLETTPENLLVPEPGWNPPLYKDEEPKDLETSSRQLALMNAHIQVEIGQPEAALVFLQPLDPEQLAVELKAVFYRVRGHALLQLRRFAEAGPDLERSLALFEALGSEHVLQIEIVRNLIGLSLYRQNRIKEALKHHQRCLEAVIQGQITNPRYCLMLFANLANEYYLLGNCNLALSIYKNDALPLAEQGEDDLLVASIFWGASQAFQEMGEAGQAVIYMDRSVKLYKKHQAWPLVAQALDQLGVILMRREDYKLAGEVLTEALNLAQSLDEPRALAFINLNTAYLYLKTGRLEMAKTFIETSVGLARKVADNLLLGQALETMADIQLAQAQPEQAFQTFEEAVCVLSQTEQHKFLDEVLESYSEALKNNGQFEKALEIHFKMRKLV